MNLGSMGQMLFVWNHGYMLDVASRELQGFHLEDVSLVWPFFFGLVYCGVLLLEREYIRRLSKRFIDIFTVALVILGNDAFSPHPFFVHSLEVHVFVPQEQKQATTTTTTTKQKLKISP